MNFWHGDQAAHPSASENTSVSLPGLITLVVTKPLKCQLIQPPITIIGNTFVRFPFSMSVIIEGSVIGLGAGVALA